MYDVAQVCKNGHVITDKAKSDQAHREKFCRRCGAETIMACPECSTPIRGQLTTAFDSYVHMEVRYLTKAMTDVPRFCHNCGASFPWTQTALESARELATTFDDLSVEDRRQLSESLNDLVRDTPQTTVAVSKFRKIMSKVGRDAYDGMKAILIEVVSETVRKSVFGDKGLR
jgi:hypothetical protein